VEISKRRARKAKFAELFRIGKMIRTKTNCLYFLLIGFCTLRVSERRTMFEPQAEQRKTKAELAPS